MRRRLEWTGWIVLGLPAALVGVWSLVLATPGLAVALLLLAALLIPLPTGRQRWRRARLVALALVLMSTVVVGPLLVTELGDRLEELAQKKDRGGSNAFSFRDELGVYGLNLVMAAGGYIVGYPEVAGETLALAWSGPPTRSWDSDFALGSPRVRAAIRELTVGLPPSGDGPVALPRRSIAWPVYSFDADSMRVALAVNCPFLIEGSARRVEGRWTLDLTGTARIAYPRRSFIPLGLRQGGKAWGLDEGIFWALEERGWLHPYTATWHWTVDAADERLRDTTLVDRTWRERAFRAAWSLIR